METMIVIPVVNVQNAEEAKDRMEKAAGIFATSPSEALAEEGLVHLDISDGVFTPHMSWGSPEEISLIVKRFPLNAIKFEVHLMVSNPEGVIDAWLRTGLVKRIIVHLEAMTDSVYLLEKCKKYGAEAMLAINPGTEAERVLAHKDDFRYFQVLAVSPGPAGQTMTPGIIDKIKFLRRGIPDAIIEVDGGIVPETAKLVREAGADIVVSGSYIFSSPDPKARFEELKKIG